MESKSVAALSTNPWNKPLGWVASPAPAPKMVAWNLCAIASTMSRRIASSTPADSCQIICFETSMKQESLLGLRVTEVIAPLPSAASSFSPSQPTLEAPNTGILTSPTRLSRTFAPACANTRFERNGSRMLNTSVATVSSPSAVTETMARFSDGS